jgi:N utilization substance protein B
MRPATDFQVMPPRSSKLPARAEPVPPPAKPVGSAKARRSAARLAAVQALYQIEVTGTPAEAVIGEFVQHRIGRDIDGEKFITAEPQLFSDIVRGTSARREDVDRLVGGALSEQWTLERLELPLRAVLRAGAWELLATPDTAPGIVINDYVEVAHAFFGGREPGMVNGVLDRIARVLKGHVGMPSADGPAV